MRLTAESEVAARLQHDYNGLLTHCRHLEAVRCELEGRCAELQRQLAEVEAAAEDATNAVTEIAAAHETAIAAHSELRGGYAQLKCEHEELPRAHEWVMEELGAVRREMERMKTGAEWERGEEFEALRGEYERVVGEHGRLRHAHEWVLEELNETRQEMLAVRDRAAAAEAAAEAAAKAATAATASRESSAGNQLSALQQQYDQLLGKHEELQQMHAVTASALEQAAATRQSLEARLGAVEEEKK